MTKIVSGILKSCPSCGAEAVIERILEAHSDFSLSDHVWYVRCRYCSFKCGGFQVRSNALKRWNTRVKEREL